MKWGLSCATVLAALSVDVSAYDVGGGPLRAARQGQKPGGPTEELGPVEPIVADGRQPASLLLFPEFENTLGTVTLLTVTNTADSGPDVRVEFVYIDHEDCSEFNRVEILTPNDTVTLLTEYHNPQVERGYVYAFARAGSVPIVWNHLIGNAMRIDGLEIFGYSTNPVSFVGIGSDTGVVQDDGTPTDLDDDGNRDLDGKEYAQAPDELQVPRFLGQSAEEIVEGMSVRSKLVLIALSGGAQFTTTVDFLIYNDNEEVFSSEYTFDCWDDPELLEISGIFANEFLSLYTNQDPDELFGADHIETGWFRMEGAVANSSAETIHDPAVYCVLVEEVGADHSVADLPFSIGARDNGSLLPHGVLGDGDPTTQNGDDQ